MKIAVIIPAYNEEKTIGAVLSILTRSQEISEIIVVNDGSSDRTGQVAANYGVTLIQLPENRGKGGAVKAGLDSTQAEIILFLDADLIGLNTGHVNQLLAPVVSGQAAMSIGLFEKGRIATDLAQKVAPYLTGQRAVRRSVLEQVNDLDITRFGFEIALTRLADVLRLPVVEVQLHNLTHVTKEEKMGLLKGFAARLRMYWEIVRCYAKSG
ncbi:MAG: Poly-beta-1,6-N-acetyl-D-glucosamine synthase [Syntrophomonadaceae bacterium]|nr:Poly-beta-1,6-N-acetyl-D-glucosamine synthase [Bacillota bacterium]